MQLDWLDGEMTDQCGQDRHPANHSPQQESKTAQVTSDIYGLSGSISSGSADLQSFLENRLARRLHSAGLTNSKLTWSQVTTVAGRSLCRLQVSEPCITETDSGSWPTPIFSDGRGSAGKGKRELPNIAKLTDWLTPTTSDMNGVRKLDGKRSGGLNTQATAVPGLWATPNTLDHMAPKSEEAMKKQAQGARKGRTFPCNLREQVDVRSQEIYAESASLWPTVTTQDNAQMAGQYSKTNGTTLGGAVRQCNAKTEKSGSSQLNPRFSLWLMGYPIEWGRCAERVTPLSRRSRQKS